MEITTIKYLKLLVKIKCYSENSKIINKALSDNNNSNGINNYTTTIPAEKLFWDSQSPVHSYPNSIWTEEENIAINHYNEISRI